MKRAYFEQLEAYADSIELALDEVLSNLAFNSSGLVPVITQDETSKEVLMLAWMNIEAIRHTLTTGYVTYWSRSRSQLWLKGETSGHTQELVSFSIDCDGDAILCKVNQKGGACHTGRGHCFYLKLDSDGRTIRLLGDGVAGG